MNSLQCVARLGLSPRPVAIRKKPSKPVVVARKKVQVPDEFSAAGGMPFVPGGMPGGTERQARSKMKELTWGEFDRSVQALARQMESYKPQAVIGLVHGGVFVGGALASALKVEFFPLRVTQRSRDAGHAAHASEDLPPELTGKRVVIVDDIASSGDSIVFATRLAKAQKVKSIKSAALIARPNRFEPDFVAQTSDAFFVFPWDYQDLVADRRFDTAKK